MRCTLKLDTTHRNTWCVVLHVKSVGDQVRDASHARQCWDSKVLLSLKCEWHLVWMETASAPPQELSPDRKTRNGEKEHQQPEAMNQTCS